jgi:hypothetical protein
MALSPEDCAMLAAYFEGVEAARKEVEGKWGVGRVELLAGDDLRAKWRRQCASWRTVYAAAWESQFLTRDQLQAVQDKAAAMQRGYVALDAAAEEAGHRPIAPWVWEVLLSGGEVAAIVQTNAEAGKVIADGRYLVVYTLAEVGAVIAALPDALALAKQTFPGARFQVPRFSSAIEDQLGAGPWRPEGDEIPFGDPIGRELQAAPALPPSGGLASGRELQALVTARTMPVEAETWD